MAQQDILNNAEDWKYAPNLVATNIELKSINAKKAVQWAKEHNKS